MKQTTNIASISKNTTTRLAYLVSLIPGLAHTFIYREIFELERRGHRLCIYSLHRPDRTQLSAESLPLYDRTYYLLPAKLSDVITAHAYYVCFHPFRYIHVVWKMLVPFHHRFKNRIRTFFHFGEGVVLARKMEKDGITHLHSHYINFPASVGRVVHLLTGISYSISAHAYDIWQDPLLLREKLREARFVACCSEFGRAELVKQGDPEDMSKVHVIYHGIDVRRFLPPVDSSRRSDLILAVGRLDPIKGFRYLVTACHILKKQGVRFECRIVGEGEERERLSSLIAKYNLGNTVSLVGTVFQERLLAHYHEAAVFVLPCVVTPEGASDGIPNVLVEAMSTSLPVVSTPISGIPELISDGNDGFLVCPNSPEELAACLKRLLQDALLRRRIGAAARNKICVRFDNRKLIESLIKLLSSHSCLDL